ncbi:MAG: PQQ-dependent sugar dehydrogenase, partial [Candidatus Marinimicrobia bacterium]|nr:PQQ-dependent sugar dehydrogenase [Candidatus Neomarinimicrobiota bacterium]
YILFFFTSLFLFAKDISLSSIQIANGFTKPVYVCQPPGDNDRLFVLEQKGIIKIIKNGKTVRKPYADLRNRIHNPITPGDERGLLGLAFHANYQNNGFVYINYSDKNDHTIVSRFRVASDPDRLDTKSEKVLIKLKQPFSNHNGGHMEFGPDGYLYISVGDGGKWGDPYNNAQNLGNLFGKILRIDVDTGDPYAIPDDNPFINNEDAKDEIWLYGLRNVWRFSFDWGKGDVYLGDVGQDLWEEIDFVAAENAGGQNFGWRVMEGNHCYNPKEDCEPTGVLPIFEYPNDANYMKILTGMDEPNVDGCSVTGGYVYRGSAISELQGTYFFADYCSGNIWTFKEKNGKATEFQNRTEEISLGGGGFTNYISSFGEDNNGELYIVDYNGIIFKLTASK